MEAAARGAREWGARSADERAQVLVGAAARLRERRLELAALAMRECAKPWTEADADVCETIDFLEYYARAAVELERGRELLQVPGERNEMRYAPRGVAAVIAPWNFPLAIACGMTAGALAAGNAAVLKPAEQSPGCALEVVRALREAGLPADALALLPGEGETGAALVRHPGVHVIAFTGSAPVGLEILEAAAQSKQGHLKHVVAEMGGKNCVIVDADADLDEAVPGIVSSAFVYAGPDRWTRAPRRHDARRRSTPARAAAGARPAPPETSPSSARTGARRSSRMARCESGSWRGEEALEVLASACTPAGTTRSRCSRAAGARGMPCRRRGRRSGSRPGRAGPRRRGRPGGRRRARAAPGARGRSSAPPVRRL